MKRILQNRHKFSLSATLAIVWLSINLFLAVFAYFIIPDKTKNANTHIPQLALKEPGFQTNLFSYATSHQQEAWKDKFVGLDININQEPILKSEKLSDQKWELTDLNGNKKLVELGVDQKVDQLNRVFIFGTDKYGRDLFSRIVLGLRISFLVGLISVGISVLIGIVLGLIAGYFGGIYDKLIMFVINSLWSIPTVLLVFAIVISFGRSISVIFIAVGLTMWIEVARLVRGMVLQIKEKTYVRAAETLGISKLNILSKHILPNIIGPITVLIAANFAIAILIEAGLSYLGFGVQPPTPSLGNLLNENYGYALSGKTYMAFIPAIAIMLLVLSFNLIGNALSNIFDAKEN